MKIIKTLFLFLFVSTSIFAQDIEVPKNLKLESPEDYKKTEKLVIDCTNWLQNTPVNDNPRKRKEINTFLMKWITGSPTVSISLVEGIVPMDCPDCLMSFLSGWTKYSLENNYSKNNVDCATAAAENTIKFYKKNKSELGSNTDMKNLIQKQKKGKLRKFIESKL